MKFIDNWTFESKQLTETKISGKSVYDGDLVKAWRDEVRLPDGNTSFREYLKHPGASVVLPVFENGDILLVGQFRYPLHQAFLEVPAGKIDPGEPPETTAVRELEEETGLQCDHIKKIGHFHPCIGYSDEIIHLYAGWGLSEKNRNTDDDEFLTHHRIHFRQALELVDTNQITDSKTIICLLRTWRWWQQNGPFSI